MSIEFRIAGYVPASLLLEREPRQWHALVLLDSGQAITDFALTNTLSLLNLPFDDIESPDLGKHAPTTAQIAQAMEFAHRKEKLLISCRAGRGRSVALAYVICCQQRGVSEALKLLDPTRLVVSLGNAILDSLDILGPFEEWRQKHAHIRLADYYDEMEKEFTALESQGASNRICEPRPARASPAG